jgi:hypothetical protein
VEDIPRERHRRVLRYVLLNPCRKALVADPLSWPWSTARDRVGFSCPRVGPIEREPARFHHTISNDETVAVGGTELPVIRNEGIEWGNVINAMSELCRCDATTFGRRGRPRELLVKTAWMHGIRDIAFIQVETGLCRAQVYRLVRGLPPLGTTLGDDGLDAAVRVVGDARFMPLPALSALRGGWHYRGFR